MAVTVPDAKGALIAQLRGRPDLESVKVGWGLPAKAATERERMFILGVQRYQRPVRGAYQAGPRQESYTLAVLIEVHHHGTQDAEAVERRAWELHDALDATVETIDSTRWDMAVVAATEPTDPASGPTSQGWLQYLRCEVSVQVGVT